MATSGVNLGRWVLTALLLLYLMSREGQARRRPRKRHGQRGERHNECVLFKATNWDTVQNGASFLEIGRFDFGDSVEISFDVLADPNNLDGILLAAGTENFQYYKYQAYNTQFFVIEFSYSALSVLLKARNTTHLVQLEIFKTYPKVYNVADGEWHKVRVIRDKETNMWYLYLDRVYTLTHMVDPRTDIRLYNRPTYIGGRPDYQQKQFRGVMKNLHVNGERVLLHGLPTRGQAVVWHCSAPEVRSFLRSIRGGEPDPDYDDPYTTSSNTSSPIPTTPQITTERNWRDGHLDD